ncbi:MAG: hypothetical protein Q9188_005835 [Gyalolechia gomerana]
MARSRELEDLEGLDVLSTWLPLMGEVDYDDGDESWTRRCLEGKKDDRELHDGQNDM